ncbi:GNAT family N-acetyltransferase [Solirubrobacter soli]|uniref:GNAT family N-acetyltransferase n=1 Tax=Solirubrobacter soli TaxID=363832 RepID=UPI00069F6B5A|nr:GNAT family protein [Solirubrobacter soli]
MDAASLRRAVATDLDALIALAERPEIARTLAWDAAETLRRALSSASGELLVVEVDGGFAGGVRWELVNRRSRITEIRTLMLDPAVQGRGLAVRVVRELCDRLFDVHGIHRVEAEVMGINDAARGVFERAGFVLEGVRRRAYDRHGSWQDGVRYGLLVEERTPERT